MNEAYSNGRCSVYYSSCPEVGCLCHRDRDMVELRRLPEESTQKRNDLGLENKE